MCVCVLRELGLMASLKKDRIHFDSQSQGFDSPNQDAIDVWGHVISFLAATGDLDTLRSMRLVSKTVKLATQSANHVEWDVGHFNDRLHPSDALKMTHSFAPCRFILRNIHISPFSSDGRTKDSIDNLLQLIEHPRTRLDCGTYDTQNCHFQDALPFMDKLGEEVSTCLGAFDTLSLWSYDGGIECDAAKWRTKRLVVFIRNNTPLPTHTLNVSILEAVKLVLISMPIDVSCFRNTPTLELHLCSQIENFDQLGGPKQTNVSIQGCNSLSDFSCLANVRKVTIVRCAGLTRLEPFSGVLHLNVSACRGLMHASTDLAAHGGVHQTTKFECMSHVDANFYYPYLMMIGGVVELYGCRVVTRSADEAHAHLIEAKTTLLKCEMCMIGDDEVDFHIRRAEIGDLLSF